MFAVDDSEWRKWMNQHFYTRQGVSFKEMSDAQRDAAFALLGAGLSANGLKLTRDIMKLNHTLAELNNDNFAEYGEWLYHLTIMGTPSPTEPWGWQLDGHHAIINYFVLGDQVVMTPLFVGSEPVIATSGKYAGTRILQDEQDQGFALIGALDAAQRQKAIIETSKTGNNNLTEAFKDNTVVPYAGLRASEMNPAQQRRLLDLIALYVSNMDEGHARVKMQDVERHLGETRFAWVGGTEPTSAFYYRIHSPVILIEFDHQRTANLRHLTANPELPQRQHIHVVVRTPNGNDYGKDLSASAPGVANALTHEVQSAKGKVQRAKLKYEVLSAGSRSNVSACPGGDICWLYQRDRSAGADRRPGGLAAGLLAIDGGAGDDRRAMDGAARRNDARHGAHGPWRQDRPTTNWC